ncbi:hypothetical protein ES705_14884 [subsurface metagenome]
MPEAPKATPTDPILNDLPNESEIITAIFFPVNLWSEVLIFSASLSESKGNKVISSLPSTFDLSIPALAHTKPW